jgi:hypothetical protein
MAFSATRDLNPSYVEETPIAEPNGSGTDAHGIEDDPTRVIAP